MSLGSRIKRLSGVNVRTASCRSGKDTLIRRQETRLRVQLDNITEEAEWSAVVITSAGC